ncbi:hypothetical protein [Fodinicola feengrottensis]|uniref:hypothetical protein n=1 Tax=Fodinicola feengrottensis TaxID=435914 RepID=UPI0013D84481|nr:hypothetical protein [Fodinicola feengrottensis]
MRSVRSDDGSTIVEFVFLGIVILVPLMYVVLLASDLQRNAFGVTEAARQAGRAYATADDEGSARRRADYAMGLARSPTRDCRPTARNCVLWLPAPTARGRR